ncbi:MAG: hypothetical protein COA74_11785 [Gammaproteobacteria bacterium]|nr:MAG: hypothetical protein COA74_11785 [Gammaproteobacteria bacterium]
MTLTRNDLWSLEQYAEKRAEFRTEVLSHKQDRVVNLNDNARLIFEDEMTLRYQIQEMLRIEKVFEAAGIQEELDVYNPLIPDGDNWKATFMLEYTDIEERREQLSKLIGVEDKIWMQVTGHDKVYAIADEDLPRQNDVKTSSVHFMRFQLLPTMIRDALNGAAIVTGCDHDNLTIAGFVISENTRLSLVNDLQAATLN